MELGLFYQLPVNHGQDASQRYQQTVEQIMLADGIGFRTAWLAEYHFNEQFSSLPSPLLFHAHLAAVTQRIRLGTAMIIPALYHKVRLAEEIGMVDVLSNGRLEIGLGRGSSKIHFQGYNIPINSRTEELKDKVAFIKQVYKDSYKTDFPYNVNPKPLQLPHPPISIAANSKETVEFAIQNKYPLLINSIVNSFHREFKRFIQFIKSRSPVHGIKAVVPVLITDGTEQRNKEIRKSLYKYLGLSLEYPLNEVARQFGIFGTPEECKEKIANLASSGLISELICWVNPGGLIPHSTVVDSIEQIGSVIQTVNLEPRNQ